MTWKLSTFTNAINESVASAEGHVGNAMKAARTARDGGESTMEQARAAGASIAASMPATSMGIGGAMGGAATGGAYNAYMGDSVMQGMAIGAAGGAVLNGGGYAGARAWKNRG